MSQQRQRALPQQDQISAPLTPTQKRIAIIGAGPAGLEAAHYAVAGGFTVRVFEAAAEVAPNVRRYGHLSLVSSWSMLTTPVGRNAISEKEHRPADSPRAAIHPSGEEFLRRYLVPMAMSLPPKALWLDTRVVALTRPYLPPGTLPTVDCGGNTATPMRLLTRNSASGEERTWSVDYVLDCTAGGRVPSWSGGGGIPAIGEMGCTHMIYRNIPDVLGKDRPKFAGKSTLLLGCDANSATTAHLLSELAELHPDTKILWAVEHDGALPCPTVEAQNSSRNQLVVGQANLLVKSHRPYLAYSNRTFVEETRYNYDAKKFFVTLQVDRQTKRYQFDNIVANVGQRQETSYLNCLSPADPSFFTLGAMDPAGSDSPIRIIHRELRDKFRIICSDPALDLYGFDAPP